MSSPASKELVLGGNVSLTETVSNGATHIESTGSGSQLSTESSEPCLDEDAEHSLSQNKTELIPRAEPDAIHPRFRSREHLLFKCRSCSKTSPKERKIQKHFLKRCNALKDIPKYSCLVPECKGPSFAYEFKQEIRIYHDCKEWAKFMKSSRASSYLSSISLSNSSDITNSCNSTSFTNTISVNSTTENSVSSSLISLDVPSEPNISIISTESINTDISVTNNCMSVESMEVIESFTTEKLNYVSPTEEEMGYDIQ